MKGSLGTGHVVCEGERYSGLEKSIRCWDRSDNELSGHSVEFEMVVMLVAIARWWLCWQFSELVMVVAQHRDCCEVRPGYTITLFWICFFMAYVL